MNFAYSDLNQNLGSVQNTAYTGLITSMPVVEASLLMFANVVDLDPNQAITQTIRVLDQLKLSEEMLSPISRSRDADSRTTSISGKTVPLKQKPYGVKIEIDNLYKVNTKEVIIGNCVKLLADWKNRLYETLLFNMLKKSGQRYVFAQGSTTSGGTATQANETDLLEMKSILNQNRVNRCINTMVKATDQIGTASRGNFFAAHVSNAGRKNWEKLQISMQNPSNHFVRPFNIAGISSYLYQMIFYLPLADVAMFASTEMDDTPESRVCIMHGDQAFVVTGMTPMETQLALLPTYFQNDFDLTSALSFRTIHDSATVRDERIIVGMYTD